MSYSKSKLPSIRELNEILDNKSTELRWTSVEYSRPVPGHLILLYSTGNVFAGTGGFGGDLSGKVYLMNSEFITYLHNGDYWIYVESLVDNIEGIYNK